MRTKEKHKDICSQLLQCVTKSAQESLESETGVRYSVLIDLSLFDPISFVAVDPMHNTMLGTAKHVMSFWTKSEILTQQNLLLIQERSALLSFPYDCRMP